MGECKRLLPESSLPGDDILECPECNVRVEYETVRWRSAPQENEMGRARREEHRQNQISNNTKEANRVLKLKESKKTEKVTEVCCPNCNSDRKTFKEETYDVFDPEDNSITTKRIKVCANDDCRDEWGFSPIVKLDTFHREIFIPESPKDNTIDSIVTKRFVRNSWFLGLVGVS